MKKLNCIIVDDESIARDILEEYINRIESLHLVAKCHDALNAYNVLQSEPIDLVFLDIQMPQLTGIDLLNSLERTPKIIFTTAYTEYALKGYEFDTLDYLLKPISFDRFLKAVDKAMNQHLQEQIAKEDDTESAFIYLKSDAMMVRVMLRDILFVESVRNCIHVHLEGKILVSYLPISSLEQRLPASQFLRIHRSFIVARNKIEAFSPNLVQIGKHKIPVGRNYKEIFLREFNL
ncbi:MAG: response regulator transcription factor [Bacteroidota bacterium]|nr:MAG: response regulator transcription factor [Bacteroidota bacterium]